MSPPTVASQLGPALSPLKAAFAQMKARQPDPLRVPAYHISLYASHDLMTFSAICNQVGSGDYDSPEDAVAAAVGNHSRFYRRRAKTAREDRGPEGTRKRVAALKAKRDKAGDPIEPPPPPPRREFPHHLKGGLASSMKRGRNKSAR